jgi:sugar phosphate permease
MPPTPSPVGEDLAASTVRTVTLRLMPLLGLLYLIAYIDRQNVSYAKLEMVGSLGLSETAYGLGSSNGSVRGSGSHGS